MSKLLSSIVFSIFLLFQTTAIADEDTTETNITEQEAQTEESEAPEETEQEAEAEEALSEAELEAQKAEEDEIREAEAAERAEAAAEE